MQGYSWRATVRPDGPFVGPFPIDMLRYDNCWPAREDQMHLIIGTFNFRRGGSRPQEDERIKKDGIEIACRTHGKDELNFEPARWASFGWKLTDVRRY